MALSKVVSTRFNFFENVTNNLGSKFQAVSESQSKLAAGIVTLQALVCRELPRIVHIMLQYTRDKASSKLRSRGMTGLEQLIEQDPRLIDEQTAKNLIGSLADNSPMVREHTLSLVSKCLEHEPSLERHFLPSILRLTTDTSNGPKKKAIKLLKDVYVGPTSRENKLQIAAWLLLPSQDDEKAIAELSRNVLEEIWLMPTAPNQRNNENHIKLDRTQRASFMADIVQMIHGQPVRLEAFEKFFAHALSSEAKNPGTNLQICQELVADMIDEVISPETLPSGKSQAHVLHALSTFAKVRSTLFTTDQVQLLKLYIKALVKVEELALVQPTVTIFRHVFPTLPSLQQSFAEEVRANLMGIVAKLSSWAGQGHTPSRDTLVDVAHCLWIVSPMVDGGIDKLFVMVSNILCQLRPMATYTKDQVTTKRNNIASLLILIGTFGKVGALDQYSDKFREKVSVYARNVISRKMATEEQLKPLLSGTSSASLLLLETVRPFTMQTWEMSIREHALRSVGGICQQSPELFMRAEIEKLVKLIFINQDNDQLKLVALTTFNDYFTYAERRSETGAEIAVGEGAVNGSARLETSFVANENDSATLHLAQKFLANFVDIALKNNNELAFFATNIIASISRQGLVHPKECGAALVALGTSSNARIAYIAGIEHKRIHEKQESYLEKEYMQAIRMAFDYQRDVFGDSHGMLESSYTPKLSQLFDALKTGKKVTFKKFVQNLCKRIDFDLPKLSVSGAVPDHVLFARFCLENVSLLDFPHLESVAIFIDAIEAIVLKTTGPVVALAIETEMPKQLVTQSATHEQLLQQQYQPNSDNIVLCQQTPELAPSIPQLAQPSIDDERLRRIATACMILQMVWETRTFVRRCYNLHKFAGRIPQKEYAKPAQRNNFMSGKELWERLTPIMKALDSRDTMVKQCYDFADLLEVDREAKIDEDDIVMDAGYETPAEDVDAAREASVPTSGRGRKRKGSAALTNTPKKARGRPAGGKNKKRASKTPDGDDDSD
jgi:cohesin loading factor subunit SCC2